MNSGPVSVVGIVTGYELRATGWTVRGSNPGGGEIFRTCPHRPWGPPSLLYNGYRFFPGGKKRWGVTLTPHLLLVPWSRKVRTIPLLPLWAVRPVQSLSACTRVQFTFFIKSTTIKIHIRHIIITAFYFLLQVQV